MILTARSARLCRPVPRVTPSPSSVHQWPRHRFSSTPLASRGVGGSAPGGPFRPGTDSRASSSYNVTDADIMSLAKLRQHSLSLADLVKYDSYHLRNIATIPRYTSDPS